MKIIKKIIVIKIKLNNLKNKKMSSETKKNISRNYNTSKNNNESTSLETLQEKIELSDSIYEHFIDELTLIKFNLFST